MATQQSTIPDLTPAHNPTASTKKPSGPNQPRRAPRRHTAATASSRQAYTSSPTTLADLVATLVHNAVTMSECDVVTTEAQLKRMDKTVGLVSTICEVIELNAEYCEEASFWRPTLESLHADTLIVQSMIAARLSLARPDNKKANRTVQDNYLCLLGQLSEVVSSIDKSLGDLIADLVFLPDGAGGVPPGDDDPRYVKVEFRLSRPRSTHDIWMTTSSLLLMLPRELAHWDIVTLDHVYENFLRLIEAYLPMLAVKIDLLHCAEDFPSDRKGETGLERLLGLAAVRSVTDAIQNFRLCLKHDVGTDFLDKAWSQILDRLQEAHDHRWIDDAPVTEDFIAWRAGEQIVT